MKWLTAMQPTYWPPLHYFQRVLQTDVFVILDTAQYVRKGWQNQCWLRDKEGRKVIVTVPVTHGGYQTIRASVTDASQPWKRKHRLTFESLLGGAACWSQVKVQAESFLELGDSFGTLVENTVVWPLRRLGYAGDIAWASRLPVQGKASEWMLNLCTHFGATSYVCGQPAYENYLNRDGFEEAGVKLIVQDWHCPSYSQRWPGFVENLSILDLVANVGFEAAADVLNGDGRFDG